MTENLLTSGITSEISKYLSYSDFQALMVCSKFLNKTFSSKRPDFRQLLVDRLSKKYSKSSELLDKIDYHEYVITGSTLLACLYDGRWEPADLDIFVNLKGHAVSDRNYISKVWHILGFPPVSSDTHFATKLGTSGPYFTFNRTIENLKVNVICTFEYDPMYYIDRIFDADIFKNTYRNGKLYVKSWKSIFERQDSMLPSGVFFAMCYYNKTTLSDVEQFVEDTTNERIQKYKKRNISITKHPNYKTFIKESLEIVNKHRNEIDGRSEPPYKLVKMGIVNLNKSKNSV